MKYKLFNHLLYNQGDKNIFFMCKLLCNHIDLVVKPQTNSATLIKRKLHWYKFWKPSFYKTILQNFINKK